MNECGLWLWSATDRQQHRHHHQTPTKRTTTDGAYIYLISLQCKLNAQQFTSPTIQVAVACRGRASTWGCKRRLTSSISPHRTKCTNQQRNSTTDTILSCKIIGPYEYTYYYNINIVLYGQARVFVWHNSTVGGWPIQAHPPQGVQRAPGPPREV